MSQDEILTLARAVVALAQDPSRSPEAKVARVAVQLTQLRRAALREVLEPLERMARAGCIVTLGVGPYGWHCRVMDPETGDGKARRGDEPKEAIGKAFTAWEAAQGLNEPQETTVERE